MQSANLICLIVLLKFGLSGKHTKFEKYLPHGMDVYKVNVKSKFLCASQKVRSLEDLN